jgi:hypothetical protein
MAVELEADDAIRWARCHARALRALRLNKQFPPWQPLAQTAEALALSGSLRLDEASALLAPREWSRARADRELAPRTLGLSGAEGPRRAYLSALLAADPPPARRVEVALRHAEPGGRARYRVVVDRIDVATGTVARYTVLLDDEPGERISPGELALTAADRFADELALLGTQDAALALAVLRQRGVGVEEVVRGVIGPAVLPGRAGPEALYGISAPAVSARLERVSVELRAGHGHIDDPIPGPLTVPAPEADFGLAVQRKWAAAEADLPEVRAWLATRRSRNLVYGYVDPGLD